MTGTAEGAISEELFLERVAALSAAAGSLSPLAAGLLLAAGLGIARDTRTFARVFGLAHALVLREVTELAEERGLLAIADRNARTQRTSYSLTDASEALLSRIDLSGDGRAG